MATRRVTPYGAQQPTSSGTFMVAPLIHHNTPSAATRTSLTGAVEWLEAEKLREIRGEWSAMVSDTPSCHLFDLPEISLPDSHEVRRNPASSAIIVRVNGELCGALAIAFCGEFYGAIPAPTIRAVTGPLSLRMELAHHPAHRALAARLTWEALRDEINWRVLELPNVPCGGAAEMIAHHARKEGYRVESLPVLSIPYMNMGGELESTLPHDSRDYRKRLDTKLRKLGHLGTVHLRCWSTLVEPFVHLLRLEQHRERATHQRTLHHIPGGIAQLRKIGRWAEKLDALRIYSLELNGEPLAMIYGVAWRGTYYAIRIACEPNFAMYSPGQLVVMQTLPELARQGTARCELVSPALPWTTVWTSSTHQYRAHYIFRPNRYGGTPLASLFTATRGVTRIWHALRGG